MRIRAIHGRIRHCMLKHVDRIYVMCIVGKDKPLANCEIPWKHLSERWSFIYVPIVLLAATLSPFSFLYINSD